MANPLSKALDSIQSAINNNNPLDADQMNAFKADGFLLPSNPAADGNGLPYSKIRSYHEGQIKRNIITWFVPEFGAIKMYVNPNRIVWNYKKSITKDKTKGGYTLQYWGEDLDGLSISGTTGSSGIEGINMLYEIYRAEQYAFDGTGLTLAGQNAAQDLSNGLVNGIGGAIGNALGGAAGFFTNRNTSPISGVAGSIFGGLLGAQSPQNNLSYQNIPSLAQLAFTVEMYYNGSVCRGFFENMTVTESSDFLFEYSMTFSATQKRGYRQNFLPFHRSPVLGTSEYETARSFDPNKIT